MGDLKALGSEKLQGTDKLRRIMEIARYNETPKQNINNLQTTNYTVQLSDGFTYGIVKEKSGYIIKKGINESSLGYSEPMQQRKYFKSYSEAIKKLNLSAVEINRVNNHLSEIKLLGEQPELKKKFVLKTPKSTTPTPEGDIPPPVEDIPSPEGDIPPPEAAPEGDIPAPEGDIPPPVEDIPSPEGDIPPPEAAPEGDIPSPEGDIPAPEGDIPAPEGDIPPPPEGDIPPPPEGDMDTLPEDMPEDDDDEKEIPALKSIQRLTGKLSQKIRAFDKEKGLDSQDIKYVMNSIISAMDLDNLDEDDKDDILSKFDDEDDYGDDEYGDLNISNDDEDLSGEELEDPELGVEDVESPELGGEEVNPVEEPKEGYQNMMDSIFSESRVENVLSNYFNITPSEKLILDKKRKKTYINEKLNNVKQKKEIIIMSETINQRVSANKILNEYENSKLVGKTNKNNLIFLVNGEQVKVTPSGRIL